MPLQSARCVQTYDACTVVTDKRFRSDGRLLGWSVGLLGSWLAAWLAGLLDGCWTALMLDLLAECGLRAVQGTCPSAARGATYMTRLPRSLPQESTNMTRCVSCDPLLDVEP